MTKLYMVYKIVITAYELVKSLIFDVAGELYIVFTILFRFSGTRIIIYRTMEKFDMDCGHTVPNHVDI